MLTDESALSLILVGKIARDSHELRPSTSREQDLPLRAGPKL